MHIGLKQKLFRKRWIISMKDSMENDIESSDIACIVSIKPGQTNSIVQTVRSFLNNIGQKHSKIYLFLLSKTVENTEELESLADNIYRSMQNIRTCEKSVIHLFLDTLAPLAFVLGSHSTFPGEVKLYEYFTDSAEYELSLTKNMA